MPPSADDSSPVGLQVNVDGTLDSPVVEGISNQTFKDWYRQREFEQNILEGKSYFNGSSPVPEPNRHRPSKLLRCHRYVHYHRNNAPKETKEPLGAFWFGSEFEEQVVVPFLQSVVSDDLYVTNSVWIEETVVGDDGEALTVKGVTDPVIVTENDIPVMVTEVKTSSSVEYRDSPSQHHRAQLQSYLYALNNEYEHDIPGLLMYWGKDSLDLVVFSEPFDREFWDDEVVPWMSAQSAYQRSGDLPPDDPRYSWECEYCPYANRCGKTDVPYENLGVDGFVPGVSYPIHRVNEYLKSRDAVEITPTIAREHPELRDSAEVLDLYCLRCETKIEWENVVNEDQEHSALCLICRADGELSSLTIEMR